MRALLKTVQNQSQLKTMIGTVSYTHEHSEDFKDIVKRLASFCPRRNVEPFLNDNLG